MMKCAPVTLAALALLSACGKSEKAADSGAPMAAEDVAKAANDVHLKPGQWEVTAEIVEAKMEGMPAGAPDMSKQMLGQKTDIKHCVTPEEAAKPGADFLAMQDKSKCKFSTMDFSGGRINTAMTCQSGPQGKMTVASTGTYLPQAYDIESRMTMTGMGAPGASMTIRSKVKGRLIGPCTEGDKAAPAANSAG